MRRLRRATELLDGPLDERSLRGNLRDLSRLNRWLGGVNLSWRAMKPLLTAQPSNSALRVLDVGTGAGDIPLALSRLAHRAGRELEVVATDVRPEIVAIASTNVADAAIGGLQVRLADRDLVGEVDRSFDVVHSSLVLHHHDPDKAEGLLREMRRVSRRAVIVNDLDRGRLWWAGAWLLSRLFSRNRYTRHDAPLSVRRAYRAAEVSRMARSVGLREAARHRSRLPYRYALVFEPNEDQGA